MLHCGGVENWLRAAPSVHHSSSNVDDPFSMKSEELKSLLGISLMHTMLPCVKLYVSCVHTHIKIAYDN